MSFTQQQINEVKKIVNEQVVFTTEQSHFTDLTISEKLTTLIKSSLYKLNTDSFLREWFKEPESKVPVLKNVILTDLIKPYLDIQNDYYGVVKIGEKLYVTNQTVSNIVLNFSKFSFDIILLPDFSLPVDGNYKTVLPIQEIHFDGGGLLTKLPREAWVVYKYWLNKITGTNGIDFTATSNESITGSAGSGTFPTIDDNKSLIITLNPNGTPNPNKTYEDYVNKDNQYIKTLFNDYDSIKLIKISDVEEYIQQHEKLDYDNDYETINTELYSKIDKTIDIILSAPTISTWNKSNSVNQPGSGYTDNIAFYNPLLENTLNERFGYFPLDAGNGYTIVCSKDTNISINTESGKGGTIKEGTFAYSSFEGFLLSYGLKNIIASLNDSTVDELPISAAIPPLITAVRYIGGTLEDSIIQQGASLPTSGKVDDLFINTTDRKIYRYTGTDWISVGGNDIFKEVGEERTYTERDIAIGKTEFNTDVSYALDVSGLVNFNNQIITSTTDISLISDVEISGNLSIKGSLKLTSTVFDVTDNLYITGGKIGIGTSSIATNSESLYVNQTVDKSNTAITVNSVLGYTGMLNFREDNIARWIIGNSPNTFGGVPISDISNNRNSLIFASRPHTTDQGIIDQGLTDISLSLTSSSVRNNVRVVFTQDGRVGIGMLNPKATLDVSGDIHSVNTYVKGNLEVNGNYIVRGNKYTIHTDEVEISNNTIILNSNIQDKPYESISLSDLESGIIIKRAKIDENISAEPFKIVYNDDRNDPDEYLQIGISGDLQRVATIKAQRKTAENIHNDGAVPVWDASYGRLDVEKSQISISNERIVIQRDLQITGKLFDVDGDEFTAGASIVKAQFDNSANELLKNKQSTGDIYYNMITNLFKMYSTLTQQWRPIELGTIGGQPPPLMNISTTSSPNKIQILWTKPQQIISSITTPDAFNTQNSSAGSRNALSQNIIHFPIVNRFCMLIYPIVNSSLGTRMAYPLYSDQSLYQYNGVNGNVIYRKGDAIFGETASSRTTYVSYDGITRNPNRNILDNMPNGINIYKVVPGTLIAESNIIEANNSTPLLNIDNALASEYRVFLWMENNSTDTNIQVMSIDVSYGVADRPSAPVSVGLALTDFSSSTRATISVVDPSENSIGIPNEDVFLSAIKYEWSIDDETYYPFSKIFDTAERTLVDGVFTFASTRNRDSTSRNYRFDISSGYMGTNHSLLQNQLPLKIYVRVSYKNTANVNFGNTTKNSSPIVIGRPSIVNITSVIMTSNTQATITLPAISAQNIINVIPTEDTISTNTSIAVRVSNVDINVQSSINDGGLTNVETKSYNYTASQNTASTYVYNLPNTTGTSKITYRFSVRIRNNVLTAYSEWSNITGTDNDAKSLSITSPGSASITAFTFSGQQSLNVSVSNPPDGSRGLPIVKASSGFPDVGTSTVVINSSVSSGNQLSLTSYSDISDFILRAGDSSKNAPTTTSTTSQVENQELVLITTTRNDYVTNTSSNMSSLYYSLGPPDNPSNNSSSSTITNTTAKNSLNLVWTAPTNKGLKYGSSLNPTTDMTSMVINKYRIIITANRIGSGSPYYRSLTTYGDTPSIQNIRVIASQSSSAAATSYTITRDTTLTNSDGNTITEKNNVLVYPDTTYTINLFARNRYFIENTTGTTFTISTGTPSAVTSQLTSVPTLSIGTTGNLNNSNNYANKGHLFTTPYTAINGTSVQVTNVNSLTSYTSAPTTHRMNRNSFKDIIGSDTYITDVTTQKLRQFRILNEANNNEIVLQYGADGQQFTVSSNDVGATSGMLSFTSSSNADEYATRDTFNVGYWRIETFTYNMNFANKTVNLYGVPVKLKAQMKYNNSTTTALYTSSTLNTNFTDASNVILQNSSNTSEFAYFDNIIASPTLAQNGSKAYITQTANTNKLNGIPNLSQYTGYSYTYTLAYVLNGYSQYYGLDNTKNFAAHRFVRGTTAIVSNLSVRKWGTITNCTRSATAWTIDGITITPISSSDTTSNASVDLQVIATNTFGTANLTLLNFKFIYDRNTVTTYNTISSSLCEIPANYLPDYNVSGTTGTSSTAPSAYTAIGNNTNAKQLSMYDGLFYGNRAWRATTGITTSNCATYGIPSSIPVFTADNDTNYTWSIFKYTYTATGTFNFTKIAISLGTNTDTNIDYTDLNLTASLLDLNANAKVYVNTGRAISNYYWFNISQKSSIANSTAVNGNISYAGSIGDSSLETTNTTVKFTDSTIINQNNNTAFCNFTTAPKRLIGGYVNSISLSAGNTQTLYVAIGIKNNNTSLYFSKPNAYLITQTNNSTIATMS